MTKKIFCLLLCAFLGVSLIALFAACHNAGQTPDEPQTTTDLSQPSTDANAALTEPASGSDAPTVAAQEAVYRMVCNSGPEVEVYREFSRLSDGTYGYEYGGDVLRLCWDPVNRCLMTVTEERYVVYDLVENP